MTKNLRGTWGESRFGRSKGISGPALQNRTGGMPWEAGLRLGTFHHCHDANKVEWNGGSPDRCHHTVEFRM